MIRQGVHVKKPTKTPAQLRRKKLMAHGKEEEGDRGKNGGEGRGGEGRGGALPRKASCCLECKRALGLVAKNADLF